jgi:hypothetical protein
MRAFKKQTETMNYEKKVEELYGERVIAQHEKEKKKDQEMRRKDRRRNKKLKLMNCR